MMYDALPTFAAIIEIKLYQPMSLYKHTKYYSVTLNGPDFLKILTLIFSKKVQKSLRV